MKVKLLCIAVFFCQVSVALAGNVDTYGIGAKATALGGAFAAYADDPFAAYYNPAGLAQIEKPMFSLGTHFCRPSISVDGYRVDFAAPTVSLGPQNFQDHAGTLVIPHLGFAAPIGNSLTAGIALYVPYGLDLKWGGTPADLSAYNAYHVWYMREVVSPTLAYKISEKLSLGAGLSFGKSRAGLERLAYAPFIIGLHNSRIETDLQDDMNWSVNAGILYKPSKSLSAGLTYRGRTTTRLSGRAQAIGFKEGDTLTVPAPLPGAPLSGPVFNTSVRAETQIDHPEQLQFGLRYLPLERISLEVDVVWTRWSEIDGYMITFDRKFLDAPSLGPYNPGSESEYFRRDWQDTTQIRFGAEWRATRLLTLRGSYFYDPSPIPDRTMDLQWADADKRTFALGAGLNLGKVGIDAALQYTLVEGTRDIGGESENLNGSYAGGGASQVSLRADGHVWGGGITVNYQF